jgi:hypothetical protein
MALNILIAVFIYDIYTDKIMLKYLCDIPPRWYPYFDVVVGLARSHEPESYAGGSVCYW